MEHYPPLNPNLACKPSFFPVISIKKYNPLKIKALDESEIEVVGRIPIVISANEVNEGYLATKKNLMGHLY